MEEEASGEHAGETATPPSPFDLAALAALLPDSVKRRIVGVVEARECGAEAAPSTSGRLVLDLVVAGDGRRPTIFDGALSPSEAEVSW